MTAGSVLFAGANGLVSQDNSNLYWDDTNNRLGIGTTSPFTTLHIEYTTATGNDKGIRIKNAGSGKSFVLTTGIESGDQDDFAIKDVVGGIYPFMIKQGSGNIGIGTTNPSEALYIFRDSYIQSALKLVQLGIASATIGSKASDTNLYISNTYAAPSDFGAANKSITLTNSGNVGIGTTSPLETLVVKGPDTDNTILARFYSNSSTRGSFIIRNGVLTNPTTFIGTRGAGEKLAIGANNTEVIRITDAGNVGIGTTSPSHLLDVASQAAITAFGGFATKFKLGAAASGGWIVRCSPASAGYVVPCGLADGFAGGQDMPIGVIYHTTPLTAVNSDVWVVTAGKAKVMLDGQAECSYGYFLRTSDTTSGAALASQNPTVPADASHWREIGHAYGHASGALVECILHFN